MNVSPLLFSMRISLVFSLLVAMALSQENTISLPPDTEDGILFIENIGQIRDHRGEEVPDVLFLSQAGGVDMFITRSGVTHVFQEPSGEIGLTDRRTGCGESRTTQYSLLDMKLVGMNRDCKIIKEQPAQQAFRYFSPACPEGLAPVAYKKVTLDNIYDGIDLVYYEDKGKLKYDFVVKAGADPGEIEITYDGALALDLDEDGGLTARTELGEVREGRPYTYLKTTGKPVACAYERMDGCVRFRVADYDREEDLVIDPLRVWVTYYGGNKSDEALGSCTDSMGNYYVVGLSGGGTFPLQQLAGAYYQGTMSGYEAPFILKFDANGKRLWATYYNGHANASFDLATGVCADSADNIYVVGATRATNFPTQYLHGAYNQSTTAGDVELFILKFDSHGQRLWATYYGGSDSDHWPDCCTDQSDNLYVTGATLSDDFPFQALAGAYNQSVANSYKDAFILKFNNRGERLWSTYYGGGDDEWFFEPDTDSAENLYVIGYTESTDFPTQVLTGAYNQPAYGGGIRDAIISKFDSSGARLWATYYGGSESEYVNDFCIDHLDQLYIAGYTHSPDFPIQVLGDAYNKTVLEGSSDAYILKFDSSGQRLWATFYGGSVHDVIGVVDTDSVGNLYVGGHTTSSDFPLKTLMGAYNNSVMISNISAFIGKFTIRGKVFWTTLYSALNSIIFESMCCDHLDNIYLTGDMSTGDLLRKHLPGAYNQPWSGIMWDDCVIFKFTNPLLADSVTASVGSGGPINLFLKAGTANAGRWYLILGSMSGSSPGTPLPGGLATLPVNWDHITDYVLRNLNGAIFTNFLGPLDAEGQSLAQVNVPTGLDPANIGRVLTFAFCLEGTPDWDFASVPVEVEFVP